MRIDYFFSTISPFTYLAGDRLERIAKKQGAEVSYKPCDLMGLFGRTGGLPPKDRHISRRTYRLQELNRISKMNGMPLNLAPANWPTNPEPSSIAVINSCSASGGDTGKLVRCFLRSCWAEEKDIANADVVAECLSKAGFSTELGQENHETAMKQYKANTEEAYDRNVFGAPTYVVGQEVFWGQDRLTYLEAWLEGRLS